MSGKIFARIEWKDTSKNPQEVKTTPSRNDLDLVKGLKRLGQALHAPKLPRSAGIPDSLTTSTAARRVAFARFASLRSIDDSGRGLRPRTIQTTPSRKKRVQHPETTVISITKWLLGKLQEGTSASGAPRVDFSSLGSKCQAVAYELQW